MLIGQAIEALASMQRVMSEMERRLTSLEDRTTTQPVKVPSSIRPVAGWGLLWMVSSLARWFRHQWRRATAGRVDSVRVERQVR
jgi:hypothetical protein